MWIRNVHTFHEQKTLLLRISLFNGKHRCYIVLQHIEQVHPCTCTHYIRNSSKQNKDVLFIVRNKYLKSKLLKYRCIQIFYKEKKRWANTLRVFNKQWWEKSSPKNQITKNKTKQTNNNKNKQTKQPTEQWKSKLLEYSTEWIIIRLWICYLIFEFICLGLNCKLTSWLNKNSFVDI